MDSVLSYLFGAWSIEPLGRPTPGRADLVAAHAVSDGLLAVACFSISVVIVVFVKRRSDFEYGSVAWLFIGFITFCGLTHLISLVTLWVPIYGLHGMVKSVTAIVSLASAIMLWFLLPKILALPSLRDLREKNEALGLEMARCQRYQQELKRTEERFREAFVNAPHGMAILSVDGDFLDVNEA
ncbi:MAG: histidine kinase, partial [Pseudomonadota bacterium]